MGLRVLGIMAHPDDVEFSCAGTLIRLKQEAGCEIAIATASTARWPNRSILRPNHGVTKAPIRYTPKIDPSAPGPSLYGASARWNGM